MKTSTNQLILPLNLQYIIPEDDPVILFNEICEQLDYTKLYDQYKVRPHFQCRDADLLIGNFLLLTQTVLYLVG